MPEFVRPRGPWLDGKGRKEDVHARLPKVGFEFSGEVLVFFRVAEKYVLARVNRDEWRWIRREEFLCCE
jgi:hypothetical protein